MNVVARSWESFLSPRDREHIRTVPARSSVFGTRPALILIDNYADVFGERDQPILQSIKSKPRSTGIEGWQALGRIVEVLDVVRKIGLPIVHVTGLSEQESGLRSWTSRRDGPNYPSPETTPVDADELARQAERFRLMDEVRPEPGEYLIKKNAPSAFFGTALPSLLRSLDVDTLLVGGESTSGCIRASVVDGMSHGYAMFVIEDCVYDRHEASHAINLFDMDRKYATVLDSVEALRLVRDHVGRVISPDGPAAPNPPEM